MRARIVLGMISAFVASAIGNVGAATSLPAPAPASAPVSASANDPTLALAALDRKIADLDSEEASSKKELTITGARLAIAHARAVSRGRSYYRLTRAGMLPVGGGFDALVDHALRVERVRRALIADLEAEQILRSRGAELASSLERVARDRVALSSQRDAMDAARLAVADEARRQSAFEKAFESSGHGDYVAVYGGAGASGDLGDPGVESAGGFASSRGRLLFPVVGRAEVRPARREGIDGPALEIHATSGAAVRSVFAGRVSFADRYGSYGRIVIVDHGDHYYSVSGNLGNIDVHVGDEISAGERIGSVGDEGQGPLLYFEIRHGSQTVPPGPWLGL